MTRDRRRTEQGLGGGRDHEREAVRERGRTDPAADASRTSREPSEGGDLGLPGGDKAARTPEEERRKSPRTS